MGTGALEVRDASVQFDGVQALTDVSLRVERGEILGLIGPNGAGKTTMINCITGYIRPDRGSTSIDGTDVTGWPPQRMARAGLARTFQAVRLFGEMTVRENVELGALLAARGRRAARERAEAAMEMLGVAEFAAFAATTLPYGLERKVAVARAIATEPTYLLLDEPAAGLNEGEGEELADVVRKVRDRVGCGVIIIEHDVELVLGLSDRLHVLNYGETLAIGTAEDVRKNQDVIDAYLGTGSAVA